MRISDWSSDVCSSDLHRTDYAASMIDGRTVMEVDNDSSSAAEITALWKYIWDRLEKNFRRTVFAAPNSQSQVHGMNRSAGGFGRRVAQSVGGLAMSDPGFASLNPSLLARKGGAKPRS